MNSLAVVFNPKSHPVAVDSEGFSIGGFQSVMCDVDDPVAKLAIETGHLVIVSVADPTEVTNFSTPTFTASTNPDEQRPEDAAKKRSPRKKPAQAKEN